MSLVRGWGPSTEAPFHSAMGDLKRAASCTQGGRVSEVVTCSLASSPWRRGVSV